MDELILTAFISFLLFRTIRCHNLERHPDQVLGSSLRGEGRVGVSATLNIRRLPSRSSHVDELS